ncbi:MAG: hypothetical protein PHF20_10380 [Halothiobacillaceae bacterium]|nr:hypothetical protein [Halothiobacillaceae bacterium]
MSSNLELELGKQFKASQEKYIYFLLAVAASAIAYAMTQSKVEPIELRQIPLGLSILSWGLSFFSGLRFIEYATNFTFQNQNYLAFKRELKSYSQDAAIEMLEKFKAKLKETTKKQEEKMRLYGKLQSTSLLAGAAFYVIWHVLRMHSVQA